MNQKHVKWRTASCKIDIATSMELEALARVRDVSISRIMKEALAAYLASSDFGSSAGQKHDEQALIQVNWLKRIFFHVSGRNIQRCHEAEKQIEHLVAEHLRVLSGQKAQPPTLE